MDCNKSVKEFKNIVSLCNSCENCIVLSVVRPSSLDFSGETFERCRFRLLNVISAKVISCSAYEKKFEDNSVTSMFLDKKKIPYYTEKG